MADKIETTIFQAKAYWCKLLGKPRATYDGNNTEWTVDLLLDHKTEEGMKALNDLKEFGIDRFYIKKGKPNKDGTPNELTGKPVLKLDRKGVRKDGSPANPVPIAGPDGKPWDGSLIGNGSTVNVKIMKFPVKLPGQPQRMKPYLLEIQVWDHVPYEGAEGGSGFPTKAADSNGSSGKRAEADNDWGYGTSEDTDSKAGANHQPDGYEFDDEIPF